jgi:hypothetical protein
VHPGVLRTALTRNGKCQCAFVQWHAQAERDAPESLRRSQEMEELARKRAENFR